jgi:excisionase family DNA binding protein
VSVSPLLTTREVAALLGLSPATVLRRWRAGELPGYRLASNVLRFSADELEEWLEARRAVTPPMVIRPTSFSPRLSPRDQLGNRHGGEAHPEHE